jgi:hypothetical protein
MGDGSGGVKSSRPKISPAAPVGPAFRQSEGTTSRGSSVGRVVMTVVGGDGQERRLRRIVLKVVPPTSSPRFCRRREFSVQDELICRRRVQSVEG